MQIHFSLILSLAFETAIVFSLMPIDSALQVIAMQSFIGIKGLAVQNYFLNLHFLVWTFLDGVHSTCETLFIYEVVLHIIYVIHMIIIAFLLLFILKLVSEKVVNSQWKIKGKNMKTIDLPKNLIEKHVFIVLVNFIHLTNKIFQT